MRKWLLAIAAIGALLAVAPASNQGVSQTVLGQNASGNYTLATAVPSGVQIVDWAHYKTYVNWATPAACPRATATGTMAMDWNAVIACASSHTPSQQSDPVTGNYHTVTYTATFDSHTGIFVCHGPFGSDGYAGTPVTLPAGTLAPTSSSTELQLTLSTISFPGTSTSIDITLRNPSGGVVYDSGHVSTQPFSHTYFAVGAPAGAWSWVISDIGGSDGTCDPDNGAQGGGTQSSWSGTATWFQ